MSPDYDKKQWQEEQAARDAALERQREKQAKARERSARNARRKIERLRRTLTDKGEISDFENEFGESIVCLLYTSPSPRDGLLSRMPSSA